MRTIDYKMTAWAAKQIEQASNFWKLVHAYLQASQRWGRAEVIEMLGPSAASTRNGDDATSVEPPYPVKFARGASDLSDTVTSSALQKWVPKHRLHLNDPAWESKFERIKPPAEVRQCSRRLLKFLSDPQPMLGGVREKWSKRTSESRAARTEQEAPYGPYLYVEYLVNGKPKKLYLPKRVMAMAKRHIGTHVEFWNLVTAYWNACTAWGDSLLSERYVRRHRRW